MFCWLHGKQANLDLPDKNQKECVPRVQSRYLPILGAHRGLFLGALAKPVATAAAWALKPKPNPLESV